MSKTSYLVTAKYQGQSYDLDEKIRRAARISSGNEGSGLDFLTGERDISFHINKKHRALRVFSRISTIPGVEVALEKIPA